MALDWGGRGGGGRGGMGGGPGRGADMDLPERPRTPAEKRQERQALWRGIRYLRPHLFKVITVLGAVVGATLLDLIQPLVVKELIDKALPSRNSGLLDSLVVLLIIAPTVSQSMRVWQQYANQYIAFAVTNAFRADLYHRFIRMPMSYHVKNRSGEAMSKLMNDCQTVSGIFQNQLPSLLGDTLKIVSTIGVAFALSPLLTGAALVMFSFYVIPTRIFGQKLKTLQRRTQEQRAIFMEFIRERIGASTLIRISATEKLERRAFDERNMDLVRVQIRSAVVGRLLGAWSGLISSLGTAVVYGLGGWLVIHGQIGIGTIAAFTGYLGALYQPIQTWSNTYVNVLQAQVLLDRIFTAMDLPVEDLGPGSSDEAGESLPKASATVVKPLPVRSSERSFRGDIRFEGVTFRHADDGPDILHELTFGCKPGDVVAFVGRSGAGKSTVLDLVLGLSRPQAGRILIDGTPLEKVNLQHWRDRAAVVSQDTLLWNDTIMANIRYGTKNVTDEEIIEACMDAQLHEWILTLPDGYDTIVGTRGQQLSGGQRQRVSIARAFLRQPDVLLLDEATSALDTQTERLIMDAVRRRLAGKTVLIVAHRLSTVRAADRIYVVDRGQIVETGTHEALLATDGLYASLYDREESASHLVDALA